MLFGSSDRAIVAFDRARLQNPTVRCAQPLEFRMKLAGEL